MNLLIYSLSLEGCCKFFRFYNSPVALSELCRDFPMEFFFFNLLFLCILFRNLSRIYAGGDAVRGADLAVTAADGRKATLSMLKDFGVTL